MKLPITVAGLKKTVRSEMDTVMDAWERGLGKAKAADGRDAGVRLHGEVNITGNFGVDKHGNLGIVASIFGSGSGVPIAEAEADMDVETESELNQDAKGTLGLRFTVEAWVVYGPQESVGPQGTVGRY